VRKFFDATLLLPVACPNRVIESDAKSGRARFITNVMWKETVRRSSFGMAALLLAAVSAAQPVNSIPDHVCLPSVSEEDAAWNRLQQELASALQEFNAVDAPAKAAFKAEEKLIMMDLIKRKKELDARYEAAYRLTQRLNPSRYPCDKPELRSPAAVAACKELAAAADLVRIAKNGECRDISPSGHEAFVKDGSPCEDAAKKYWNATSSARSRYQQRTASAQAAYRQKMLPACSLWQRITLKELDRPTLRARQTCVAAHLSPADLTACTQAALNRR